MDSWDNELLYLLIEFQHATNKEIIKEFHNILRNRRKVPAVKESWRAIKGMKMESTNKEKRPLENDPQESEKYLYRELHRYLKVYDYRKERFKFSEITDKIQKEFPKINPLEDTDENYDHYLPSNLERETKRDFEKAKKIICNVERGYFPGDFQ